MLVRQYNSGSKGDSKYLKHRYCLLRIITAYSLSVHHCLFAGVIAVVIFVILSALALLARFLYRRKETFQSQPPKGVKPDDSPEFPFNSEANSQNVLSENQKEYFI